MNESPMDHIERRKVSLLRPVAMQGGEWGAVASGMLYERHPSFEACVEAINAKRVSQGLSAKEFAPPKEKFSLPTASKQYAMSERAPKGYAAHLGGGEIASYIVNTASDPVDYDMMQEHFGDSTADLKLLAVSDLVEGDAENNQRSSSKEKRYFRRSPLTIPPLVVDGVNVLDGNHRLRVARAQGVDRLWCYVVNWVD